MFNSNIRIDKQNEIIGMLGVDVTDGNSYYLGLPSVFSRYKRVIFGFLKDRLHKRCLLGKASYCREQEKAF